jgi:hypothetical protein
MLSELEAYRQGFSRCLLLDFLESVIVKNLLSRPRWSKPQLGSDQSLIERFCQDVGLWVVKAKG